jgi:hypothetical protein
MRDPKSRLIAKFAIAWSYVPDWRFGQLVSNLLAPGPQDVFGPENDVWEVKLDMFINEASVKLRRRRIQDERDEEDRREFEGGDR